MLGIRRIAVLEFVCGGGFSNSLHEANHDSSTSDSVSRNTQLQDSLVREGWGMLHHLSMDLHRAGFQVVAPIDRRLSLPGQSSFVSVEVKDDYRKHWVEIAKSCDATIVIAPEIDHQLEKRVEELRTQCCLVLASDMEFLAIASNKWETSRSWEMAGVPTLPTYLLSDLQSRNKKESEEILRASCAAYECEGFVVKHVLGAGCFGTQWFPDPFTLLRSLDSSEHPSDWLVQPWVRGRSGSVAILAGRCPAIVGTAEQWVDLEGDAVVYRGGQVPMLGQMHVESESNHGSSLESNSDFEDFAWNALRTLPGSSLGWIGIDFLIPDGDRTPVALEVNPRLTTSYLGHRQRIENLAAAMISIASGEGYASMTINVEPSVFPFKVDLPES